MSKVMLSTYLFNCANKIFGIYQQKFSEAWDERLNELLDHGKIVDCSEHTLSIDYLGNEIDIWCSNKWHSFGHEYRVNGFCIDKNRQYRPRLKTMVRLFDVFQSELNKKLDSQYLALFKDGA